MEVNFKCQTQCLDTCEDENQGEGELNEDQAQLLTEKKQNYTKTRKKFAAELNVWILEARNELNEL